VPAPDETDTLLELADDELLVGWRDSEWTGVAPYLEEDVAFSSIAQNEIGHARALYDLAARRLGGSADELAFDRAPGDYRSCPLVELRLMDWEATIARRVLYELADAVRIRALIEAGSDEAAGLARKIDREEVYHRIHARMWAERLLAAPEGRTRFVAAVRELWPMAVGALPDPLHGAFREAAFELLPADAEGEPPAPQARRGAHTAELVPLWEEMTMVRRSVPGARW
jgi:ring-1,2-phenylacetyl-CoA epoxidase subunit PaaC